MEQEQQSNEDKKGFIKEFTDGIKKQMIEQARGEKKHHHHHDADALRNWRSWGSWFSWGSPVGFGLFIISIGVFLVLLHYAGLIGR